MNAIEKVTRYLEWKRKQNTCNHTSAGGTFHISEKDLALFEYVGFVMNRG